MKAGELFKRLMEIPCGDDVRFMLNGSEYEIECEYDHCENALILEAGCQMPDDSNEDEDEESA